MLSIEIVALVSLSFPFHGPPFSLVYLVKRKIAAIKIPRLEKVKDPGIDSISKHATGGISTTKYQSDGNKWQKRTLKVR
jgi:hypothetical protein